MFESARIVRVVLGVAVLVGAPVWARAQAPAPAAPDHSGRYDPTVVANGERTYGALCTVCHGPTGNGVAGVDLRRGPLPRAATDAGLRSVITNGIARTGMPSFRLEAAELDGLVAFIRSGFDGGLRENSGPRLGRAEAGRVIFETKGQCLQCHRLAGEGGFSGPDLTEIGQLRQPAALERSLLDPTAAMQPINRPVRAVRADGSVVTGRRLNEDLFTVQIITDEGRLVSLVKPELKEWTVGAESTMPSYRDRLSADELADLLAYLVTLKGSRP